MRSKGVNVLLVSPQFPLDTFWNTKMLCRVVGTKHNGPPLGLLTVAAMLPPAWSCRLVDRNVGTLRDADLAWADMIMTGGMMAQRADCIEVIRKAKAFGRPVVVGGPDVTSSPEAYAEADFIVTGEAENVIEELVAAWQAGNRAGTFHAEKFKIDVTKTPIPRFDLLRRKDYTVISVQFSRGCPFKCEFCDIIELYGRVPRTKTNSQMLGELEAIHSTGYRGHIDFVDDNFIGNKKAVKLFLRDLIVWQKAKRYPFSFLTEASINLADDDELLALMREANFFFVFVGIESPDADTLVAMQKKQNTRRVLEESIRKIYRAGIFVAAGFIVGFDSEKGSISGAMVDCIEGAALPVCSVGLLFAYPNTQLTRRLTSEGRLFPSDSTMQFLVLEQNKLQSSLGLNFETKRPRVEVLADYKSVLERIYHPRAYFGRLRRMAAQLNRSRPENADHGMGPSILGVPAKEWLHFIRLIWFTAIMQPRLLRPALSMIGDFFRTKPSSLEAICFFMAMYLHLGAFATKVSNATGLHMENIEQGIWRSPLASGSRPVARLPADARA